MELHKAKPSDDDRWRAFSYGKCELLWDFAVSTTELILDGGLRGLRNYPKRIASYAEARSIRGVGDKTALKVGRSAAVRSSANHCAMEDYGNLTNGKLASHQV